MVDASALEQFFAALGQVQHPQMLARLAIALAQGVQCRDGRVIHEVQVAAIQRHLSRIVGRVELLEKRRSGRKKQRAMHPVKLAAITLHIRVGIQLARLLPGKVERCNNHPAHHRHVCVLNGSAHQTEACVEHGLFRKTHALKILETFSGT